MRLWNFFEKIVIIFAILFGASPLKIYIFSKVFTQGVLHGATCSTAELGGETGDMASNKKKKKCV